jgi:hypothetical protein
MIKYCKQCHSNDLIFDAKLTWSDSALSYVYEFIDENNAYCNNCEADVEVYEPQQVTLREAMDFLHDMTIVQAHEAKPQLFGDIMKAWNSARSMAAHPSNEHLLFSSINDRIKIPLTILIANRVLEPEVAEPETIARLTTLVGETLKSTKVSDYTAGMSAKSILMSEAVDNLSIENN